MTASGATGGAQIDRQLAQLYDELSTEDAVVGAATVLQALSYPLRLRIVLHLLVWGEATGGQLSRELGVSHPLLAHHLRQLRLAGLIRRRRLGGQVAYHTIPATADLIRATVACANSTGHEGAAGAGPDGACAPAPHRPT
jgi:DNA-binding transcriptional ArsR family regulator